MQDEIKVGYQAFVSDGGEEFGAVRQVSPNGEPVLVVYVENSGDFLVPLEAVASVHAEKVILECGKWICGFGGRSGMPKMRRSRASNRGKTCGIPGSQMHQDNFVAVLNSELVRRGLERVEIEVDGGVGVENIRELADAGMTIAVAGTFVFGGGAPVAANIRLLRAACGLAEKSLPAG
jgi:Ribulose-phosphate 3 epimerase family